jgi:hypothetical protein
MLFRLSGLYELLALANELCFFSWRLNKNSTGERRISDISFPQ